MAAAALPGLSVVHANDVASIRASAQTASKSGSLSSQLRAASANLGVWGGAGSAISNQRRAGPGWSNRQVQRMARKRRNVARNRKAHR